MFCTYIYIHMYVYYYYMSNMYYELIWCKLCVDYQTGRPVWLILDPRFWPVEFDRSRHTEPSHWKRLSGQFVQFRIPVGQWCNGPLVPEYFARWEHPSGFPPIRSSSITAGAHARSSGFLTETKKGGAAAATSCLCVCVCVDGWCNIFRLHQRHQRLCI